MNAVLNYFQDPRISECQTVREGSVVKGRANCEEFHITEGKEYKILEVNNITLITVKNDKDNIEIYSVECFTL